MPEKTDSQSRMIGLDYMRATAVLCVLTAHTAGQRTLGALGFTGVEIFFVLSGYLIGGILMRSYAQHGNKISWPMLRDFWVRRWLRTLPNYFLFLPVFVAVEQTGLQKQLLLYATFTQNLAWRMNNFFQVSWSLTIEEWFYLLLPLLTVAGYAVLGRVKPAFSLAVLILFFVPMILRLTVCQGQPFDPGMRKIVVYRLDSLMWGVGLAAAQRFRPNLFKHLASIWYFMLGALGLIFFSWWVHIHFIANYFFPANSLGAMVLTGASLSCALALPYLSAVPMRRSRFNLVAYLISSWSYSIYLCHVPVIWIVSRAFGDPMLLRGDVITLSWITTLAVAATVYYTFERPILRWRDRITTHRNSLETPGH